jgi:dihydrofolate reductase
MRQLIVFNQVSLDGYFVDAKGDMSWAHQARDDAEWNAFTAENAAGGGTLVFGRITYQLMAGYWPTPMALQNGREVADHMNALPKVVFSRTLAEATWSNTTLVKTDLFAAIRKLKAEPGPGLAILGSGRIVAQLAPEGLIDEYQLVVHPVALGAGRTLFEGVARKLPMKLTKTRAFENGAVLLCYQPASGG